MWKIFLNKGFLFIKYIYFFLKVCEFDSNCDNVDMQVLNIWFVILLCVLWHAGDCLSQGAWSAP